MSFGGTPSNPMATNFIGSFVSVNGKSLKEHHAMALKMPALIESIPDRSAPAEMNAAKEFSQKIVAVDTGYLRSTIDWEKIGRYVYRFFASARYARFVEEGTYRMRARPYMFPAMARLKQNMPQVIIRTVRGFFVM